MIAPGELDDLTDAEALRHVADWAPRLPADMRRRLRDIAEELTELAAFKAEHWEQYT